MLPPHHLSAFRSSCLSLDLNSTQMIRIVLPSLPLISIRRANRNWLTVQSRTMLMVTAGCYSSGTVGEDACSKLVTTGKKALVPWKRKARLQGGGAGWKVRDFNGVNRNHSNHHVKYGCLLFIHMKKGHKYKCSNSECRLLMYNIPYICLQFNHCLFSGVSETVCQSFVC